MTSSASWWRKDFVTFLFKSFLSICAGLLFIVAEYHDNIFINKENMKQQKKKKKQKKKQQQKTKKKNKKKT